MQALRIADFMHARLVDSTIDSFVFEITGSSEELDAFIDLMEPLGLAEVSRAGVVAIARGAEGCDRCSVGDRADDAGWPAGES